MFLDEIGEMPTTLQPKLLRALQEQKISRVGGGDNLSLDVRVITATNRDLKCMVENGKFREDLYYRVRVLEIDIPPLREHREDIPALVEFFLQRHGTRSLEFSPEALNILTKYTYPGNVRELEHVIQRTIALTRGQIIRPPDLPAEIRHHQATTQGTLVERLDALEREMIICALDRKEWVQTQAAEALGISERVLRYKMKKHRIRKDNS